MSGPLMQHGGDLGEATRLYGEPDGGWLDLSTGINPRPYPFKDMWRDLTESLGRYPGRAEIEALTAAARTAYRVPDHLGIAAAPGTELLIRLLPSLLEGNSALLRTTYSSYAEAWRAAGRTMHISDNLGQVAAVTAGRQQTNCIVVNPNNPDGRQLQTDALLEELRSSSALTMVVDEAYCDAERDASLVPHLRAEDPVIVLKSFGKFFGLPGLRLGFAIGQKTLVTRIGNRLGDWPVSVAAARIGTRALRDEDWQTDTRHWLANRAAILDAILHRGKLKVAGGTRLFRLASTPDAPDLHDRLARAGIWTRIFADWPDAIRFGLPPDDAAAHRLLDVLTPQ